jgi:hypothetical protein
MTDQFPKNLIPVILSAYTAYEDEPDSVPKRIAPCGEMALEEALDLS